MLSIERVDVKQLSSFREMVDKYWRELMPHATAVRDSAAGDKYFESEFAWDGGNNHPHWAVADSLRVGFLAFEISKDQKVARVNNLYVVPERRREGLGTAMVEWVLAYTDAAGVERVDVNVRRDNPGGLAFWQAQGFGIAGYRLRQYRDPQSGTAFVGSLSSDPGLNPHLSSAQDLPRDHLAG